jgi:1,4-dihydroxy-2-naphthoyl-CoA hydrolase
MSEKKTRIFPDEVNPEELTRLCKGNMGEVLGIRFTEVGPDFLRATMPVNDATRQPYGLLHGGASVALAETMASVAANLVLPPGSGGYAVGLEINANHIKSARNGFVTGTCRALQTGRKISVWEVRIENEAGSLVCISRMTAAILQGGGS